MWKQRTKLLPASVNTQRKANREARARRESLVEEQERAAEELARQRERRRLEEEERRRREAEEARPRVYEHVCAFVEGYAADHPDRRRTSDNLRALAKHFVCFAGTALTDLTTDDVIGWLRDETERYAPLAARKAFELLARTYACECDAAEERGERLRNRTRSKRIVMPEKRVLREKNALDGEGARELAALLRSKQQVPVIVAARLALQLGLRQQEVCALQWRNVDVGGGLVHVEHAITRDNHGACVSKTKSRASRRDVVLTEEATEILRSRRAKAWCEARSLGLDERQFETLYVIGDASGGFVDPHRISSQWATFASIEGLVGPGLGPDGRPQPLRFHDLRHSFVTVTLAATGDVEAVASALGHASPSVTLDTYGQATKAGKVAVAEAMGRVTRGGGEGAEG